MEPDEIDCPGCDALVDVGRPLGVEVTILEEPSMTSLPARVTVAVGGVIVHRCDPDDVAAEAVARRVGELLRDDPQADLPSTRARPPGAASTSG